jgi:hypothetical protein
MKQLQKLSPLILIALIGVLGCEHDTGTDTTGVGGGQITFAGNYAPASGHAAVVEVPEVTTTPVTAGVNETIGIGDGVTKSYNFTASFLPIDSGTVQVSAGTNETFSDTALSSTNGTLKGSKGGIGTVEYATGKVKVKFFKDVPVGVAVVMSYRYVVQGATVNSPIVTQPITVLTVAATNKNETKLVLTDNNGGVYIGTSSGIVAPNAASSPQHFSVSATFSVSGSNAANLYVAITNGTFSALYDSGVLKNRQIQGTYVESDAVKGDILGKADDISVGPIAVTNGPAWSW